MISETLTLKNTVKMLKNKKNLTFGLPPASLVAKTRFEADSQIVLAVSRISFCFSPWGNFEAKPIAASVNGSTRLASLIT